MQISPVLHTLVDVCASVCVWFYAILSLVYLHVTIVTFSTQNYSITIELPHSVPLFIYFRSQQVACRILVHQPGINPYHLHWTRRVLTTGPPGKSLYCRFITKPHLPTPPPSPCPYKTFKNKENISLGEIAVSIFLSIITRSLQLSNFY